MFSRAEAIVCAAAALVFVFFAAAWIQLPGPQADELLHVPVLLPALRPATLYHVELFGHTIPLMIMSYVGALKGWLLRAWFLAAPLSVPGYRAFGIAAGLAALLLAYVFVRRWWGRPAAFLALPLLATDPSFVHTIRLDYGPVALMQFLKMGALCLYPRAPAAAGWLLGLAVWDKANFVWFLAGLGLSLMLLFPGEIARRLRAAPAAALAFLAGAAPFFAYNVARRAPTWRERGQFEVRWFKLRQAQGTFEGTFMSALTGEDQLEFAPPAGDVAFPALANAMHAAGRLRRTITLPLLGLALLLLPLNLRIGSARALLFPLLVTLLTYACMFVTFDGGASVHHVIMVYPFPLVFLAASLWAPAERWQRLRPLPVLLTAAAVTVNLSVNARHLAIYTRTGGTGGFTDAVYRLVPFLKRHPGRQLFALDWGFANPVAFLGARSGLLVDEIFYALNDVRSPERPKQIARLRELMQDPRNVFLLHSPQRTLFPAPADAFHSLRRSGVPMQQIAVFEERAGEIVYEVYRSGAPGPAGTPEFVEVRFLPEQARRGQPYVIEVPELAGQWIDLVYHVDQSSAATATRFCRLDADGRATMTVPADHPLATVTITQIRPAGGEWRPARGAIRVIE